MKKLFLLFASGTIAMNVGAQERQIMNVSPYQIQGDRKLDATAIKSHMAERMNLSAAPGGAHKTTTALERWYNYAVYQDAKLTSDRSFGGAEFTDVYGLPLWNDTLGLISYTSGPAHNTFVSMGSICQPQIAGYNRVDLFTTDPMRVGSSDNYTWDSAIVHGVYNYNVGKVSGSIVDTLRIRYFMGAGGTGRSSDNIWSSVGITHTKYGKISMIDASYDSVKNVGMGPGTPSMVGSVDILLHNTDTGEYLKAFALPSALTSSSPNQFMGLTVTFKSGDPSFPTTLPGDTLIGASTYHYNMFRPFIDFYTLSVSTTTVSTADWPMWDPTDFNEGLFKTLPSYANGWDSIYVPTMAWGVTSASVLQYPDIGFHVTCTSCVPIPLQANTIAQVNSINAYPNPSNDNLNVSFELTKATDVTVSLSNMLGQVVATQVVNNTASGKASFNTAALPGGIYIYTLSANGNRSTGRVVITH